MTANTIPQKGQKLDGLVAWDQQGLVVVWPDKHRSRFSWEALRSICLCAECQELHAGRQSVSYRLDSPGGDIIGMPPGTK